MFERWENGMGKMGGGVRKFVEEKTASGSVAQPEQVEETEREMGRGNRIRRWRNQAFFQNLH